MKLHVHQAAAIFECPPTNNFDGFIDSDPPDIIWHLLFAAHVDENIIVSPCMSHLLLLSFMNGVSGALDVEACSMKPDSTDNILFRERTSSYRIDISINSITALADFLEVIFFFEFFVEGATWNIRHLLFLLFNNFISISCFVYCISLLLWRLLPM